MTGPARAVAVRRLDSSDRPWLRGILDERWGGPTQAYGGQLVDAAGADGLVAIGADGRPAGVLLHRPIAGGWEIVLLEALLPGGGAGTALVEACAAAARAAGAPRLEVVTTNDNVRALRFYQRRGFALVALRARAADDARRRLKPQIPLLGEGGIPIRDELVLAREL